MYPFWRTPFGAREYLLKGFPLPRSVFCRRHLQSYSVFVFSDREYSGKEDMMPDDMDYGVWSEFAEEGLREDAEVDVAINLEAESKRGK